MRTDAPRDLLTLRGEPPSVRLALRVPQATIREQPEALQAPQQLRDLPRVLDPRVIPHLTVTRVRAPRPPALRQRPTPARCDTSTASARSPTGRQPPPGRRRALRGTRRHQRRRRGSVCSRRAAAGPRYGSTIIPINSPNSSVSGWRWPFNSRAYTIPNAAPTRPSAVNGVHSTPRLPTSRPPSTTSASRARISSRRSKTSGPPLSACTTQTRASTGSRSKNARIAHRPRRTRSRHSTPSNARPRQLPGERAEDVLQHRGQALLAVREQLIERAPRHPRARHHIRDRRVRPTQLIHRANRRRQQPRALDVRDLRMRTLNPLARHQRTRGARR